MQDMMKQWMDVSKSITESMQEMTKANTTKMNEMMQYSVGTRQFAEFMQGMMDAGKTIQDNSQAATQKMLQSLLGNVDLQANSTALKELGEINSSVVTRMVQTQMDMMNTYIEATTEHMEKVKAAKSADDLMTAQMQLFTELQEKMKSNTMNSLTIMNETKSAMQGWTEKTLEKVAAQSVKD